MRQVLKSEFQDIKTLPGYCCVNSRLYGEIYERFKQLCAQGRQPGTLSSYCRSFGVTYGQLHSYLYRKHLRVAGLPGYTGPTGTGNNKSEEVPFEDVIFEEAGFLPADTGNVITVKVDGHVAVSFPADTDVAVIAKFVRKMKKEDDRVREDHAILHGTTLPPSDPFWSLYLPPNGWNCRCTAVQVRKGKYPQSDPALSMLRGNNCTENAKQQIFRFNPGKDLQLFPPKHPYFKAPEDAKQVIEQQAAERTEHYTEYERLKGDPNYTDVEYDPVTGGVRASHVEHNFNAVGGKYELEAQLAGFRAGHIVIFGPENNSEYHKRHTEGTWNGLQFEVAGRETATTNNIKRGLEHCADKKGTQIAVLDFPNGGFTLEKFDIALRRYMGLEKLNDGQFLRFKKIICVQKGQIVHMVDL